MVSTPSIADFLYWFFYVSVVFCRFVFLFSPSFAPSSLSVAPFSSASVSSCDVPSSLSGTSPVVAGVESRKNKSGGYRT